MPFETGTFNTAPELLSKISTFMTANGWTKVYGLKEDLSSQVPITARYWRLFVTETSDSGNRARISELHLLDGSDLNLATDPLRFSASAYVRTDDNEHDPYRAAEGEPGYVESLSYLDEWWLQYDFGQPTSIFGYTWQAASTDIPQQWSLQYSNDGEVWNYFHFGNDDVTEPEQYRTFRFNTGEIVGSGDSSGYVRARADDYWVFQGDGYDASRRVYIMLKSEFNLLDDTDCLRCFGMIDFDIEQTFEEQLGINPDDTWLFMRGTTQKTYWLYLNSQRLMIFVKNNIDDYTSAYLGFMKAFANPDDYPQPLFIGATSDVYGPLINQSSGERGFFDPGEQSAFYRDFKGDWIGLHNHDRDNSEVDHPEYEPVSFVWPFHSGATYTSRWPYSVTGRPGYTSYAHWMDRMEPTEQGDIPLLPCIVCDTEYGAVGALDGIFAVPRGDSLSPEQIVNISGQNYRCFTNRARRAGNHFVLVRED